MYVYIYIHIHTYMYMYMKTYVCVTYIYIYLYIFFSKKIQMYVQGHLWPWFSVHALTGAQSSTEYSDHALRKFRRSKTPKLKVLQQRCVSRCLDYEYDETRVRGGCLATGGLSS